MELKLWCSFLLFHVIHAQMFSRWYIYVPTKIPAVEGSCVIIPCSFGYPRYNSAVNREIKLGFWKNGNKVVANTYKRVFYADEHRKRIRFLGNVQAQNCTMQLNDVRRTDVGPFHLRIEILRSRSFSFINNLVYIDVISNPAPPSLSVYGKAKVTAYCYVLHSCPTSPPKFSWSQPGAYHPETSQQNSWQWKTMSELIFRPRHTSFNQTLKCTVWYSGGKQATSSIILPK